MFEAGKHWRSMAQLRPGMPPPQKVLTLARLTCCSRLLQQMERGAVSAARYVEVVLYFLQACLSTPWSPYAALSSIAEVAWGLLQDGKATEASGAWLVQRAATAHTIPEAVPVVAPAGGAAAAAAGGNVQGNSSIESLTDQAVLPAPGEKVRYKQSELMRLTARRLATAAAASQPQPPAGSSSAAAEAATGHGPALVHLSTLFSSSPASLPAQAPVVPLDWGSMDALQAAPDEVPTTSIATIHPPRATHDYGGGALMNAGHAPLLPDEEGAGQPPTSTATTVADVGAQVDAVALSELAKAGEASSAALYDVHRSRDQVSEASPMSQAHDGQTDIPSADEAAIMGSFCCDPDVAVANEYGGVSSTGVLKVAEGTVAHKRRSSRTVPGLLQTITEADQEESA